jgi:hypothetical protein
MFGYLLALALACLLAVLAFTVVAGSKPRVGRRPKNLRPVQHGAPAADEPTPDRSVTASSAQADAARRATPPA